MPREIVEMNLVTDLTNLTEQLKALPAITTNQAEEAVSSLEEKMEVARFKASQPPVEVSDA